MFFKRKSTEEDKLKLEVAALRRANANLRARLAPNAGLERIVEKAVVDAKKMIDLHHLGYDTDSRSVSELISRRRYDYAMTLMRTSMVIRGGGRGKPYRWRDMAHDEMVDSVEGMAAIILRNGKDIFSQNMQNYVRKRVKALRHSPTSEK